MELIKTFENEMEALDFGGEIHELLKGHYLYGDSFIVLNVDTPKRVYVWIHEDVVNTPIVQQLLVLFE